MRYLIYLFIIFSGTISYAQHFLPNDDEKAVKELSQILGSNPILKEGLVQGGDNSFVFEATKINKLFADQINLQRKLIVMPEFSENLHEFKPLEEYHISTEIIQDQNLHVVNPDFVDQHLLPFSRDNYSLNEVRRKYEEILNKGPEGLLIGFINVLAPEQKSELMSRKTLAEKIEYLKTLRIDEASFSEKFDYDRHDLKDEERSYSGVLNELIARSGKVDTLMAEIVAFMLSKGLDNSASDHKKNAIDAANELVNMSKDKLEVLGQKLSLSLTNKSFSSHLKWFKQNHSRKESIQATLTDEAFTLAELPPYIGIFRGCFGGDCSTSYSWPFPNSPFEKVFYIINKNRVVGYVTTTIVRMNDQRMLLLKDLQGPNISIKMADQVLHFLHTTYAKKYDAEGLALTNQNFINGNNNFQVLRNLLNSRRGPDNYTIQFHDTEIRQNLPARSYDYDSPATHRTGNFYQPPQEKIQIHHIAEQSSFDYFYLSEKERFEKYQRLDKDLVLKALGVLEKNSEHDLNEFKLSFKEHGFVAEIRKVLLNEKSLSTTEYIKSVDTMLAQVYNEDNLDTIKENFSLSLAQGYLKSPNLLQTSNVKNLLEAHKHILYVFEYGDISDYLSIFKVKISDEPDEWFFGELKKIIGKGGEAAFNNTVFLFGNDLQFTDDPEVIEKVQEIIKNDLLLNIDSFVISKENQFRYSTNQYGGDFLNSLNILKTSQVSTLKYLAQVKLALNKYGISLEEASQHYILSQLIGSSLVTSLASEANLNDALEEISYLPVSFIKAGIKRLLNQNFYQPYDAYLQTGKPQVSSGNSSIFDSLYHLLSAEELKETMQEINDDPLFSTNQLPDRQYSYFIKASLINHGIISDDKNEEKHMRDLRSFYIAWHTDITTEESYEDLVEKHLNGIEDMLNKNYLYDYVIGLYRELIKNSSYYLDQHRDRIIEALKRNLNFYTQNNKNEYRLYSLLTYQALLIYDPDLDSKSVQTYINNIKRERPLNEVETITVKKIDSVLNPNGRTCFSIL